MPSLAELLNSPSELQFEGKTYLLREPTLPECGLYQRWLESEARASAAAATELPEEDRRQLLRDTNQDIAAKVYAWGGEVCVKSLRTPDGVAKLFSIVCADQGLTFAMARQAVDKSLREIAAILLGAAAEDDPEKKAMLGQTLLRLGLPANFLSSSSSDSPTGPRAAPSASTP